MQNTFDTFLAQTGQIPWLPLRPLTFEETPALRPTLLLTRGDRVLHAQWGLGWVLRAANTSDRVAVEWLDGVREESVSSLRKVVPRTVLGALIARTTSRVSEWMVRKADEQCAIEPDATGSFAGHKVHYYDVARIPVLINLLTNPDGWRFGTLVIHSEFGPGKTVVPGAHRDQRGREDASTALVQFFSGFSPIPVPVRELRVLISSRAMASKIGADRKRFRKLAASKGINPDYRTDDPRREFFDPGGSEEVRTRWYAPEPSNSLSPGSIVLDIDGNIATVESLTHRGEARLRYMQDPALSDTIPVSNLRPLCSLRQLAACENMSRYKLKRLLAAVRLQPVYEQSRTMYFDVSSAREILRGRLDREGAAVSLDVLFQRTGVSVEVLARKVRNGCILTIGTKAHYWLDEYEAERIERVLDGFNSRRTGLTSLGICRLQRRGRAGREVAGWDLVKLINTAHRLSRDERTLLFDQVAWLCEGAGRERLHEALDRYLSSMQLTIPNSAERCRAANIFLALVERLPKVMASYRIRLLVMVASCSDMYGCIEQYLRKIANGFVGDDRQRRYERLLARMDQSLTELLLRPECSDLFIEGTDPERAVDYPEDQFVPGAIIVSLRDKPSVGVIVRVAHQAWNALSGGWDKTVVVQFEDGERRMNPQIRPEPHTRFRDSNGGSPVAVLLGARETKKLCWAMQGRSDDRGQARQEETNSDQQSCRERVH